jgi:phage terminase small subunit
MLPKMFGRKVRPQTQTPKNENHKHNSKRTTLKQEKFVEGVIRHGNATRAARDAGYSPRSASVIASRNLKRADIQEQIKSRIQAAKLDTDEIIGTLIGHMRADIGNLLGDDGALDIVRAIENGSTHIIKKLTIRTRRIAGTKGGSPTVRRCERIQENVH